MNPNFLFRRAAFSQEMFQMFALQSQARLQQRHLAQGQTLLQKLPGTNTINILGWS